ncbi:tetratricopeptide repeat protein [Chryseobacterium sp. SSA4.19]|uniref:tetratricopeptide repeat-containing sensor histidine kinase n=1 Tax=Chryseobacterium sp. SSA4.19 TaxID=2919915 RepID=UPI001F4FA0A8|nr:tetratricopeptide repeat-containing sensor histidine kinase [Chryseobacterium sp. SSA4.19]MCJ8152945.1 tetratricopeptide repeat protein [Chryseobacterium sp. SSA4.19]
MKIFNFIILLFILSCSQNQKPKEVTENLFYNKAWEFKDKGDTDKALINFYKAKDLFLAHRDSIGAGKSLINIGIILTEKGDYFGAQETSLDATNYFDKRSPSNYEFIKSNYNNLGIASYNLKDYDNALKFYNLAIKFSNNILDTRIYLNNKARTLQDIKDYDGALKIYNQIFKNISKNEAEYARTLTNLAKTKWLKNSTYNPVPELKKSLEIRLRGNDLWGQNSSYAHLADYYISKNQLDSALFFANKRYLISKRLKSPDDQLEALQKLVITENPQNSKRDFILYQKLNDSIYISRSKAKNQFALIRFDVEKMKSKNAENEINILYRNIGIGALSLFIIGGIFWYKKRKKRLEQEKELEVKNTQLKMSKKVHDVVANGIYQVMTKIENQEYFDRDKALDELEYVYEKSRDLSYEKAGEEKEFSEKISELIGSFKNERVNTYVAGNEKEIWKEINPAAQEEVYQIVRELLVNMKKHSQADRVVFRFERENNTISIFYADTGIGISGDVMYKNGLSSTVSRIESINGKIIFDTATEKGLKITISFPVS